MYNEGGGEDIIFSFSPPLPRIESERRGGRMSLSIGRETENAAASPSTHHLLLSLSAPSTAPSRGTYYYGSWRSMERFDSALLHQGCNQINNDRHMFGSLLVVIARCSRAFSILLREEPHTTLLSFLSHYASAVATHACDCAKTDP